VKDRTASTPSDLALRRPSEDDQPQLVAVVDQWFGGRRVRHLVARAWFRHFASTSWIALDASDRPLGFLLGYRSPDRPAEAVIHLLGVDPNQRRRGTGRRLVEAFVDDVGREGVGIVVASAWPDDPIAVRFFGTLGFQPDDGPGSQRLYGTTGFADHEGPGEDRVLFTRVSPHR
jgi:ribosomal protein S18 acetylase RimI-like enzyme